MCNHLFSTNLEVKGPLEGDMSGDGLLSPSGSSGATRATMFSFFDSQKAA